MAEQPRKKQKTEKSSSSLKQLSDVDHVLKRPAVYFGSSLISKEERVLIFDRDWKPIFETCLRSAALEKAVDEVIINARDHAFRKGTGVKNIRITLTEDGAVVVENDGKGLRLEKVTKADGKKCWSPELAFGNLRSGNNFDDEELRTTGGCNGVGSKLTNLFSSVFQVETRWVSKIYRQKWEGQMSQCEPPSIEKIDENHPFRDFKGTRIMFFPRYDLFGIASGEKSIEGFIRRRCLEIAATTPKVSVFFNREKVPVSNLKQYAELFVGKEAPKAHLKSGNEWECVVVPKLSEDMPTQMSFVNGIPTTEGGTHVTIYNPVGKAIAEALSTKKETVKPSMVRKNMCLFVAAIVPNPQFNHQGKTKLESKKQSFGSLPDLSVKALKKATSAVKEHIQTVLFAKNQDELSALSRRRRLFIPKLDDASEASKNFQRRTGKEKGCMLLLTEGDSAKALAVAGIGAIPNGRKRHGVFPLRGKLLNTRGASASIIQKNHEIVSITRIMGLVFGKIIPREKLRYQHVILMTDADDDGSHIKGLLINFFHSKFPYTMSWPNFIGVFSTPRRRASRRSEVVDFYSDSEYHSWAEGRDLRGWTQKFYKGLGSWTAKDARQFFSAFDRHVRYFEPLRSVDEKRLALAFDKTMANDRKEWLRIPPPQDSEVVVTIEDFVDKELIHFSHESNKRSIPSAIDGLKPSQRKILWTCLTSNISKDIRVAQLAGKVSEKAMYHHGEQSLQAAIVKMAQEFVGSNNLSLLVPSGQFGTRLAHPVGSDCAAPRYIHTRLQSYTKQLFPEHLVLEHVVEDGETVEPVTYFPVIPMLLVNGSAGIGTGFSTEVLPHSISEVIASVKAILTNTPLAELHPFWNKFKGEVRVDGKKVITRGIVERDTVNHTTRITELPPNVSTEKFVQDMASKYPDIDCVKNGDTENVNIILQTDDVHVELPHLEKTFLTSNMHAFTGDNHLMKFDSVLDILREYMKTGQKIYEKSLLQKRASIASIEKEQRRRKDYIDLFCAPDASAEPIVYPLQVEQLARLMAGKGWTEGGIDDLIDSVRDREKTLAGSQRAHEKAIAAVRELHHWEAMTWRTMWLEDIDAFIQAYDKEVR